MRTGDYSDQASTVNWDHNNAYLRGSEPLPASKKEQQ